MNIKPKANIGDTVKLNCNVQTSYGWKQGIHLQKDNKVKIIDVEVSIMLSTGETKYNYIVDAGWTKAWLNEKFFDVITEEQKSA
jgi:hypothetical protein